MRSCVNSQMLSCSSSASFSCAELPSPLRLPHFSGSPTEERDAHAIRKTQGSSGKGQIASMRSKFSPQVKKRVAGRNGYRCSFPQCDKPTIGPAESTVDSVSDGVACHIFSAAAGGPRGQGTLGSDQLRDIENALWLCANHARIIDANRGTDYPPDLLFSYKTAHESLVSYEQRGVAVGCRWLQSVTIEESPVFARGSTLDLARTTVVRGGNATGKTALCEWLAGSGDISLLKRWSALSKSRGRTQVRFDAVTPLPLTWTIRVCAESNIKFEMDGQAVPRLNLAHMFVYASERPQRMPEETTSSYLARWLRIDPAHIHNIVRSLAMRGGFCVHNPRFVTQEDHEALLLDLDGTVPGLEFRSLSRSEQLQVVIEFAVEIARFEAERKPTMLLIDCMAGFDRATFQEYLEFLATQSERFQIIITDRTGNTDRFDRDIEGLRIATLRGTVSNVEIS